MSTSRTQVNPKQQCIILIQYEIHLNKRKSYLKPYIDC